MRHQDEDGRLDRPAIVEVPEGLAQRMRARGPQILVGLAILVALWLIWMVLTSIAGGSSAPSYRWDFGMVGRYMPVLLEGLVMTLQLTVVSISLGLTLGIVVALARLSSLRIVRGPTIIFIEIMRGTPALVQLVWVYYALPIVTGIQLPVFSAVVLAFTLNLGAFYGEAFRAGIQAVPREQVETADVLGLGYVQRMRYVVVPQATRIVLPVLISLSISLFKDTSLVSTLGVADLMYNGRTVSTATYRPLEILTLVGAIYFMVAFPVTLLMRRVEVHFGRHQTPTR